MKRYAIIIERGPTSFSAWLPDLPGCIATADTEDEVRRLIADATQFHIEGLQRHGSPVPEPKSSVDYVVVAA